METMALTVELPKVEVTFLKEYAAQHNSTVSKLMDAKQEYYEYLEEKYR